MSIDCWLILQSAVALAVWWALSRRVRSESPPRDLIGISADPDAAIRRVYELGFSTCQVSPRDTDDATAANLRQALSRYDAQASAAIAGGPGPEVYSLYHGPQTIGLVARATRAARLQRRKDVSNFAKKVGIPALAGHCGFIPQDLNDRLSRSRRGDQGGPRLLP